MATTHEVMTDIERELNDATARAWSLVKSTDGRLFTVRPDPKSWSAAECISHLSISTEMFLPVLRDALDDARRRKLVARKPPKMDLLGRILRWFLEPPIRQRVKTAAPFVPKSVRAKAEAFGEFASLQDRLAELIRAAADLDLARIKVVSPFDKRVKYNAYSAFRIITAHQRRHLWQAEQAIHTLTSRAA
ncbi:MAG TPA: DinB family protein [Thermoanaerobaculia bacterium]|nr:DinB family protein [Thermoanaerobaculia bacterium]